MSAIEGFVGEKVKENDYLKKLKKLLFHFLKIR